MFRVVLDTNVVVSAVLSRGPTSRLVTHWQEGRFVPLVSKGILEEYLRVLAYPKFRLSEGEVRALVERQLLPFTQPVEVTEIPVIVREDPSDNVFLACALAGKARYLVSGDHHLLVLRRYKGIPVIPPSRFLSRLLIKS